MGESRLVEVSQPGLTSIRTRQPAHEVVERPILHHDYNYMLDVLELSARVTKKRDARFLDIGGVGGGM